MAKPPVICNPFRLIAGKTPGVTRPLGERKRLRGLQPLRVVGEIDQTVDVVEPAPDGVQITKVIRSPPFTGRLLVNLHGGVHSCHRKKLGFPPD